MKVGYVTGCYPRVSDTFIQREVAALRHEGVSVDTFAVRAPGEQHLIGPEQRQEHASTTYLLPVPVRQALTTHYRLLRRNPAGWLRAAGLAWSSRQPGLRGSLLTAAYLAEAGLLAEAATQRGLDHLHNHFGDSSGSVTMLAAVLAGTGFSMTLHGPDVFFDRARFRLDVKVARAAFVVCISDFARSQVMALASPDRWGDLHVVHCGVDPAAYAHDDPLSGTFIVVTIGRLEPVKGVRLLLDAVARLVPDIPKLVLEIVGDGDDRAALEVWAQRLGIGQHVRFHGSLSQDEVRAVLRTADVFASASFAEGLPVVLMEALASGVPVVTPAIMGIPELVNSGVGRLVPPADVDALVAALRELHDAGPAARRELGDAGRRAVVERFEVRREAGRLAALMRRYVESDV